MNDLNKFKFSLRNAFIGIKTAFKTQRNLRFHVISCFLVLSLGLILKVSYVEFLILLLTILTVIISEIFNTAIEFVVDLVSPNFNLAAKKAKDVSAAAVLLSAFFSIIIGLVIFVPKILLILQIVF